MITKSIFVGLEVLHVDGAGIAHRGIIVGLSNDGFACYVKSLHPNAPQAEWHWTVKKNAVATLNQNAIQHPQT